MHRKNNLKISNGTVHKVPEDFRKILAKNTSSLETWEDITPLARNEWICWIESVKKSETRLKHLKIAESDLKKGKRRPCCWAGCIHRTDKHLSPSQKFVYSKKSKLK